MMLSKVQLSLGPALLRTFQTGSLQGHQQSVITIVRTMTTNQKEYKTLKVNRHDNFVVHVELNRPAKRNAMNKAFWRECKECFEDLSTDKDCRAIVVSGAGKMFTSGLDMTDMGDISVIQSKMDVARKSFILSKTIKDYQGAFTAIEKCPKPVIAATHNACVGGGVDMISACDIRYSTADAWFQVKEVDIGLAADVGTLQRLPKVIGNDSLVRELCYTARKLFSDEAKQIGFISRIFPDKEAMMKGAMDTALAIACKSPVAVQVTKLSLVYSRDHSVDEGLEHVKTWNQTMLQSEDVVNSVVAAMEKKEPVFSKL